MDPGPLGYAAPMGPDNHATPGGAALSDLAGRAGGLLLAGVIGTVAALRKPTKPLHPRGRVVEGRVVRHGGARPSGVAWLDVPGEDAVLVRLSRSIGLPAALPDIHGLALRIPASGDPDGHGDLLLATTGLGPIGRFVLTAGRSVDGRALTSLMPYRTDRGPVVLGALSASEETFDLCWATLRGDWVPFGRLEITGPDVGDPPVSFDPVVHQVPGLESYRWAAQLRVPAYRTARRLNDRST